MATRKQDPDLKLTRRQSDNARSRIAHCAAKLVDRLRDNALGVIELTPAQVKSAQILLDRIVPTMQSIDQTTRTETPEMSPAEIEQALAEYVAEQQDTYKPPRATLQ